MRQMPYANERAEYKNAGGKGMNNVMFKEISVGLLKPKLDSTVCMRHRVPRSFRKREFLSLAQWNFCRTLPSSNRTHEQPAHFYSLSRLRQV